MGVGAHDLDTVHLLEIPLVQACNYLAPNMRPRCWPHDGLHASHCRRRGGRDMRKLWQREKVLLRGFTLSELMVMMAVFSILATIAIPLYANAQARARIEQAQANVRLLASAVTKYKDHMGTLPPTLLALMRPAVNGLDQSAGPFLDINLGALQLIPGGTPPWGAYTYAASSAGTFSIFVIGDGTTITATGDGTTITGP